MPNYPGVSVLGMPTDLLCLVQILQGIHDGSIPANLLGNTCIEAIGKFVCQFLVFKGDITGSFEERRRDGLGCCSRFGRLSGFAEAEYLAYEVPDVAIPKQVLAQLETAGTSGRETGAKIASELIAQARSLCQGIVVVLRENGNHAAERLLAMLNE